MNEASEELVVHLPAVHGFLVFHALFGDEDVDDLLVGHGTVTFEPLTDDVAEVGWRDVESVEGAYFWSLVGVFGGCNWLESSSGWIVGWCGWWTHCTVPVSVE